MLSNEILRVDIHDNQNLVESNDEACIVEFEVVSIENELKLLKREINQGIASIDHEFSITDEKINELNADIHKLTNHADDLDYTVAVMSGLIADIIDSLVVGEWNFENATRF